MSSKTFIIKGEGFTIRNKVGTPMNPTFDYYEPNIEFTITVNLNTELSIVPNNPEDIDLITVSEIEGGTPFDPDFLRFTKVEIWNESYLQLSIPTSWDNFDEYLEFQVSGLNPPTEDSVVFGRVYNLTNEQLEELSNTSIYRRFGDENYSRSDFIVKLITIPFPIPEEFVAGVSGVEIGDLDTGIQAELLTSDQIAFNLGSVEVTGLENNIVDYVATEYVLILPYIDVETVLNPEDVVNKVLSVEVILDAYTGEVTINLYNGEELPFNSFVSSLGRELPVKVEVGEATRQLKGSFSKSNFNNNTPLVYVKARKQKLETGSNVNLVKDVSLVSEISGYFEVTYYEDLIGDNSEDQQAVKNILETGVLIK